MLNIFISWSGPRSRKAALLLEKVIRQNLIGANALISTDIESGQRWFDVIAGRLELSNFGILVVTRSNLQSHWIHFEAGALSKHHRESSVCLFLLDAKLGELKKPLSEYNATSFTHDDVLKLFKTINSRLGEQKRSDSDLEEVFDGIWPKLETDLKNVRAAPEVDEVEPAKRATEDILDEVLINTRSLLDKFPSEAFQGRGVNSFEYISGEKNAMQALIDATKHATRKIRATRFFPHAIKNTYPEYHDAISNRVKGIECDRLDHYFRIVAANSMEKLQDVQDYLKNFKGCPFTLYLTEFTNDFELVVIDDKEVFIHFYGKDQVIESTLRLKGPEIAERFSRIFTRLHDPKRGAVEKFECRYLNDENIESHLVLANDFFKTHHEGRKLNKEEVK